MSLVGVLLPVIATARALAPLALVFIETKTWGGRVGKWLNNVLIHLHNYTADIYRGRVELGIGVE